VIVENGTADKRGHRDWWGTGRTGASTLGKTRRHRKVCSHQERMKSEIVGARGRDGNQRKEKYKHQVGESSVQRGPHSDQDSEKTLKLTKV